MNAPRPGDLLDNRYLIVRSLAAGGFGQTYIAEDTRRPGNPVCVVKHLTPASSEPQFLENATRLFLTEAQTLERLGIHDQIPRLLAYFEANQEFYLVQDWIDGYPLTNELLPGQRWSESKVCEMLQEVLSILQFVHGFGVIHRDIKPDNLIRRRQDNRLVLVDFGIVKQIRSQIFTPGQGNINATIAIGTPGYMPTEQGRGNPRPNSDIYALGIIGIQAVTGLNPTQFQEDNETGEIIWRPWAQISEELATILVTMVRYHFKDRYQSTTEALQALDSLLRSISPTSPNSVITFVQQRSTIPQGRQVSFPSNPAPVNEPQFTEISSPLNLAPVNEPQFTEVSSPLNLVPVNEPQLTEFSLPASEVPVSEPQPIPISRESLETPRFQEQLAKEDLQLNYRQLLGEGAILGSGSWLLAIFLISILGTVWLGGIFWLLITTGFIILYFAKNSPLEKKFSFWVITVLSSLITLFFLPRSIPYEGLLQTGQAGLLIICSLAVFAGALAFILIVLFELLEISE